MCIVLLIVLHFSTFASLVAVCQQNLISIKRIYSVRSKRSVFKWSRNVSVQTLGKRSSSWERSFQP